MKLKSKYFSIRLLIVPFFIYLNYGCSAKEEQQNVPKGGLTMTNETPLQIATRWIDAYNSHEPDTIIALYDENAKNTQLPWGKTIEGREAMRSTFVNVFQAFPDIHLESENLIEQDSWVVIEWRFGGTMKGKFAGHAPNGNKFSMNGCEIFKIVDGKIKIQRGYWDKTTMFEQLQLTPEN